MKKILSFLVLALLFSCSSEGTVFADGDIKGDDPIEDPVTGNALTGKQITIEMGPGFNLGNTFENGNNPTTFVNAKPIIDLYANAGMKHIRIPVTWMERFTDNLADANGNINFNNSRFIELVKVVDYAISKDLYVVINTHHEHWLKDHYDGSAAFDTKFTTLWKGIASYFKDYSHKLVFEVLNEPENAFGHNNKPPYPSPFSSQALTYTRKINTIGLDAIRTSGGNNETRLVMISTNAQGNEQMIEEVYPDKASLPGGGNDKYIAIQVHSYNPWSFCGQTGSNSAFPGNAAIENAIKTVGAHSIMLDVPINYGEFGVGRQGTATSPTSERNTDIVKGYYKTFHDTTINRQMSFSVWDDRGWFGLVNSSGTNFTYNIVPLMLQ